MSERPKVLLGVSGSIAAFKAAQLASNMIQEGLEVRVVMTASAAHFVAPLTFEALTNNPVSIEIWDEQLGSSRLGHLALARWADIFVVAPATASTLARLALGLVDDMLCAVALATQAPLIVSPAMESSMWNHVSTQLHVEILQKRGIVIVGPQSGRLASGTTGEGRMSEPAEILAEVRKVLCRRSDLAGLKFLVAAGPTHEAIDPVRFIGNRGSGKTGFAIAEEARDRGADVLLITGPTNLREPHGMQVVHITDSQSLRDELHRHIAGTDVIVMSAAIADFKVASPSNGKLKRKEAVSLDLIPTEDIATEAKRMAPDAFHVTFALESTDLVEGAQRKLQSKGSDLVVANSISEGHNPFGSDINRVAFVSREKVESLPEMSKRQMATKLLDEVKARLDRRRRTGP